MSDIRDTSARWPAPRTRWGTRARKYPIARDPAHFMVTEELNACRSTYTPTARGTPHPAYPTAVLTDENPISEQGDYMVLSRTYYTIPSVRSEPSTAAYQFPGMSGSSGLDNTTIRQPFTRTVLVRTEYEYFFTLDPFGELDPANAIPVIEAFVVMTGGAQPAVTQYLNDAGGIFSESSTPSLTDYLAMISGGEEIVIRDSDISQYAGNIWERRTIYTKAK